MSWAPDTIGSQSYISRPIESIDEELNQECHHTVITRNPGKILPRKEVIQPQLPLRLPCYDFAPIASPTLDSCLRERLAYRLQVLPTFMA